jgi:hypothetical protein
MKLCVGAPVGDDREWVFDAWLDALRAQTVQPDYIRLVTGQAIPGWVVHELEDQGVEYDCAPSELPCYTRNQRTADPTDPNRTNHFCALRNQLRGLMLETDADVFLSLDTDILLTNPDTIELLLDALFRYHYSVAAPMVYLHPLGEEGGCYNAAWWCTSELGDPKRAWQRISTDDIREHRETLGSMFNIDEALGPMTIDIPMAAVAMRRSVLEACTYTPHEQGEDIGFADQLSANNFSIGWCYNLETWHVWGAEYLEEAV